jgi:hypothetical protein
MTTPARKFKSKAVDLIIASDTILDSAIANKTFLQSKRSTWADPFFQDIKTQIDLATQTYLGMDTAQTLRQSTQQIYNIVATAYADLAEVKVQIEEDFKDDQIQKNEILNSLGYTPYFATARNKDQEALINLLFQFKTNLSPILAAKIVAKGTAQASLDSIIAYADQLKDADISQEGNKAQRKVMTEEAITEFNNIYDKVISITRIAAKFYKNNPVLSDQFSFSKVVSRMNNYKTAPPTP